VGKTPDQIKEDIYKELDKMAELLQQDLPL
jgi:hypothetical protein